MTVADEQEAEEEEIVCNAEEWWTVADGRFKIDELHSAVLYIDW